LNPAAQWREKLELFFALDQVFCVDYGALSDYGEVRERGLAEESTVDLVVGPAFAAEYWSLFGSLEVQFVEARAVRVVAGLAGSALVAESVGEEDWVAYLGDCNAGSDFFDVAAA
jgi:hypothetical protein